MIQFQVRVPTDNNFFERRGEISGLFSRLGIKHVQGDFFEADTDRAGIERLQGVVNHIFTPEARIELDPHLILPRC